MVQNAANAARSERPSGKESGLNIFVCHHRGKGMSMGASTLISGENGPD